MSGPLHLFEAFGVELEYMIVDATTGSVRPIADEVLRDVAGHIESEVDVDEHVSWSNELALHVIELKTNGPAPSLEGLGDRFQEHVGRINALLAPRHARLMPTAMHPWMDPATEMRLWPHEFSPIYDTYNRIFGCTGHGWTNLQSTHINLPFDGDDELGRLHAAIRLVLPILPALAASSPIMEMRVNDLLDNRLVVYRGNAASIPSITGDVIPEPVYTRADYEREIFERMYRDIAPHDPAGTLQHEWLNSRGAIVRFDRGAIEIRVLDVQESPRADLAIAAGIVATLEALVQERWVDVAHQKAWAVAPLDAIYSAATREADELLITDRAYLDALGVPGTGALRAGDVWAHLVDTVVEESWREPLDLIVREGVLARRILRAVGNDTSPSRIREVYGELSDVLAAGGLFRP